jgi:signal transduction histidine kinase
MLSSKYTRHFIGVISILIIGFFDRHISAEINTAILYGLVVLVVSYQGKLTKVYGIALGVFAALVWGYVDYQTHHYQKSNYFFINGFSRLFFFVLSSIIANNFYVEKEQRKIISAQKESLEMVNKELNKFIGMAAHDIRNPVGSIQMLSEILLEKENIAPDDKKLISLIKTSAVNSLQILNDTLNISQIQSGTIQLNVSQTEYVQFITDSLELNKELAKKKNQTILFVPSMEAIEVTIDRSRLLQVINNLVTNAIKYSAFDTAITVKVGYWKEDPGYLLTEVIDQGMGIEDKHHADVFSPFVMTGNIPTNNESKSGLGLAIVKKIVELHHGQIQFTSEVGKGSDFYFTLPIKYTKETVSVA